MSPGPQKRKVDQSQLFIEKAREIGADNDSAAEAIMKRLTSQSKTVRKPLKKKMAAKK